jgi:hypothetical protein
MLAQRQDWVMAVNDYTIGDLTVRTRATAKSWNGMHARVRILLAGPGMTALYAIGEQTGQQGLPGYQRSSFRTVCPEHTQWWCVPFRS